MGDPWEEGEEEEPMHDDAVVEEKPSTGSPPAAESLRAVQWQVMHEAQKDIKRKNPTLPPKEVLKQARAVCFGCVLF